MTETNIINKDWEGKTITGFEHPDKEIIVWEIKIPFEFDNRIDLWYARDYFDALKLVEILTTVLMDSRTEEELLEGFDITVKIVKMPLKQYLDLKERQED